MDESRKRIEASAWHGAILTGSVNGSVEQSLPPVRAREKIDATVNRGSPNGSLSFVFLIYDADRGEENRQSFL